ncbi:Histone-lysine N-methyltransferase SETMAR [Eumeta japonica]|uniref:Histone-lysine N-methyltransferase SETMAR n=1 Tax=Eumeta variegata TaxID=151549 RepID=A0A4C2A110_EUMVA|nr:Histone-lysine N-methyltransferase SETMAR [Eumeta japonica]
MILNYRGRLVSPQPKALKDTGFSEIDHPPYSPDLDPSDYFLFSNLKKKLRDRKFVDDNQMKMSVESHFDCKEKEYFLGGLKALYTRCRGLISRPSYLKSTEFGKLFLVVGLASRRPTQTASSSLPLPAENLSSSEDIGPTNTM